jgi:hypothetical protein
MRRREALKKACKLGLCSCVGVSLSTVQNAHAEDKSDSPRPDKWLIEFMQRRLENLLSILGTSLKKEDRDKVLKELGRHCGEELVRNFAGDPEGFWKWEKTVSLEKVEYDKEKGVIHIIEKKRKTCACPMAKMFKVPSFMCICSVGTQKAKYEKLFNVPVDVKLEESILTGGQRCRFTIFLRPKVNKPLKETS